MPRDLVSLDGRILSRSQARIDPLDRGLIFGDALYEVVKVSSGRLLHLGAHLGRLGQGLERIRIPVPHGLTEACRELVAADRLDTGSLFLQVTRGVAPRSHRPPLDLEPTVLILPTAHDYAAPAARPHTAITIPDPRWLYCDLKTTSMLATVTGKLAMRDADADEVIFSGAEGVLREGGTSTLFVRRGDRLQTHPLDGSILPSVTRAQVLGFAGELGMHAFEDAPRLAGLGDWQEAFLCGTLTGVQPLVALDAIAVAGGGTGEWTVRLAAALAEHEAGLLAEASDR